MPVDATETASVGRDVWNARITRADRLAAEPGTASSLLDFYARLLREQHAAYQHFAMRHLAGSFERDAPAIAEQGTALLQMVATHGPSQLGAQARQLLGDTARARVWTLQEYWQTRSDRMFFAKALLQPYGECLTRIGVPLNGDAGAIAVGGCPRCGGRPQAAILEADAAMTGDGSSRHLLCGTCLTTWPFHRIRCPSCGERDERRLGYFLSPAFAHVRVDTCGQCFAYIKTIDRGRVGLADPLVDEVAGAPLDIWAQEHGYRKIELNLVGL